MRLRTLSLIQAITLVAMDVEEMRMAIIGLPVELMMLLMSVVIVLEQQRLKARWSDIAIARRYKTK